MSLVHETPRRQLLAGLRALNLRKSRFARGSRYFASVGCLCISLCSLFLWVRGFHANDQLVIYYGTEGWGHTVYLTSTTGQLHLATFYAKVNQHFLTFSSCKAVRESIYHTAPWSGWWYSQYNHRAIGMLVHIIPAFWAVVLPALAAICLAPSRRFSLRSLLMIVVLLSMVLAAARIPTQKYFGQFGSWMPDSENSRARRTSRVTRWRMQRADGGFDRVMSRRSS